MAHEVNRETQDVTAGVRNALVDRIGSERLELWIPEGTIWDFEDAVLTLTFASEFTCQLAQKMLGKDLGNALTAYLGCPTEVRMQASPELAKELAAGMVETHPSSSIRTVATRENSNDPLSSSEFDMTRTAATTQPLDHSLGRAPSAVEDTLPAAPSHVSSKRKESAKDSAKDSATELSKSMLGRRSLGDDAQLLWETFVPGDSNQLAWATAKIIVADPGRMTPVFLHGPSGVGKTMLVTAIAHRLRSLHRLPRVVHMTSEQFLNDFTTGLRGGGLPMFRRRYRDVETLILEDIHFFVGKRSSITEVKHTLDNLLRLKKQVIFTADRSLNELQGLGNELVGRIRGGLTAPLFPLDEDTRLKILRSEMAKLDLQIEEQWLAEIAARVTGDGRVLSGIVKRLAATCAIHNQQLDWDRCWDAIADLIQATKPIVRIVDIDRVVCDVFGLEPESLQSTSKIRRVSQPRMLAMFLARKYTPSAYKEIGQYFGKRRHSTVISAEKTVETWLSENANIELGRGLNVRQAIRHVESQLQVG